MIPSPLMFAGQHLLLDPAGAAFWPVRRTLIVADLHLEKGSSYAARGALLPPYDSRATLDMLSRLIQHYAPERVIALGDSFHDSDGAERLCVQDRAILDQLMERVAFVWIRGNHDPLLSAAMPGITTGLYEEASFKFRHIAEPQIHPISGYHGEFSGHYHPKARIETRGKLISRRCFMVDQHRLMLPALGAYSGGLDVTAKPLRALFPHGARLFLLGANRLFTFLLSNQEMESV